MDTIVGSTGILCVLCCFHISLSTVAGNVTPCLTGWDIMNRGPQDGFGWTMVSPSQVISCDGLLSEWQYRGKSNQPFRAIVWRPVTGSSTEFKIIGINDIPAGAIDTEVTFQVPSNERIVVQVGDMIGWSFEHGVITFNSGGGTQVRWVRGIHAGLQTNEVHDINEGSGDREYSIRATVTAECQAALGVADDGIIKDGQMHASSQRGGHPAKYGRLDGYKAWRPDNGDNNIGEWIQVMFTTLVNVNKIATQGRHDGGHNDEYVTQYKVRYSNDGNMWMYITDNTGDKIFTGNVDRDSIVTQTVPNGVMLRYIRIETVACNRECALRLELYGCEVPVCNRLDPPANGRLLGTDVTTGSEEIECNDGFTPMGSTSTVCTATENGSAGTWMPDISSTTCVPVCDDLNAPSNGYLTNSEGISTNSGVETIGCNDGFTPMGPTTTECTFSGNSATWMPDVASTMCVPVCVLNAPAHGYLTNLDEPFTNGDVQTIECNDGFTPIGNTSLVCTRASVNSARWRPIASSTRCVPVCDVLNAPANGYLTYSAELFTNGDEQTIECNDGFTPMGDTSTVCTRTSGNSARWNPDIAFTICVPVCDALDVPTNGYLTTLEGPFINGYTQTIECNDGFTPTGNASTVCTATNDDSVTWQPDPASFKCVPVCDALNAPENGYLVNSDEPFTDGDVQKIECDDGFTPMGDTSTECTASVLNKPTSTTISPSSNSIGFDTRRGGRRSNAGAIAGYVIGILALLVIIIVAVLWLLKRKRQTETSNPKTGQAFDGPYELTIEGTIGPQAVVGTGLADGKKDPDDNVYQDVRDKANNDNHEYTYVQEGAKKSTGDIYHDIKDKPDDYAYAYADVNAGKTAGASPNDEGLVDIYAKSRHGGRPTTGGKQNPVADDNAGDIYQAVDEDPNENEYAYADVKVANDNREPANDQEEGWEDNAIYATDGGDLAADSNKGEGWVDNNIYATTDNDEQNAAGNSQVEGWEDNIIYGDK